MVDRDELAICRRRGHAPDTSLDKGWTRCKWCGMWLRQMNVVQEREDDPPEEEQNKLAVLRQKSEGLNRAELSRHFQSADG